ncbi:MAG: aryl-sulfate sulfotransferase [Candidatus Bipolaricaulota bacterium]|nr:MAG: aryl-sulfate sulfotransferase [Candidatus Bipolaricaulota bacterium]
MRAPTNACCRRVGSALWVAAAVAVIGAQTAIRPVSTTRAPLVLAVHRSSLACPGTTLFADLQPGVAPRIVEVDMEGEIVWEFVVPPYLRGYTDPGMDVEALDSGNVLFVLPRHGIYEVSREGRIVWFHRDDRASHDADRLENGNTLYVYGAGDGVDDLHVKEVDASGTLVWSWSAGSSYAVEPYLEIDDRGWTHTNAVTRMADGNTLVNLRNFDLTVEVSPAGEVVWSVDWRSLFAGAPRRGTYGPHDPEVLADERLLVCLQWDAPFQVVEIDRRTGEIAWSYRREGLRTTRDADRLPNGNTLIVGVLEGSEESVIFEVTPDGRIAWEIGLRGVSADGSPGWFYKAERLCDAVPPAP